LRAKRSNLRKYHTKRKTPILLEQETTMPSKIPFLDLLKKRTVLFDGAMGTTLISQGLAAGESPEIWNLSHGDAVSQVHRDYAKAGADVLQTNTLGGTRMKLKASGLDDQAIEINVQSVRLAQQACTVHCYVAGDIGPTGQFLPPVGTTKPEELEQTFREQAEILASEGVDLFVAETFYDLKEIVLAVRAIRAISDLPIVATITFDRKPKGFFTIMGNTPADCAQQLAEAGADVLGSNCGLGSTDMTDLTPIFRESTDLPILIQPNRGQPEMAAGQLTYRQTPEAFSEDIVSIVRGGADAVGGCCGTTPEFIAQIRYRLAKEGLMEREG
jgi:methionine synthase I (cobalamin-dependent)